MHSRLLPFGFLVARICRVEAGHQPTSSTGFGCSSSLLRAVGVVYLFCCSCGQHFLCPSHIHQLVRSTRSYFLVMNPILMLHWAKSVDSHEAMHNTLVGRTLSSGPSFTTRGNGVSQQGGKAHYQGPLHPCDQCTGKCRRRW